MRFMQGISQKDIDKNEANGYNTKAVRESVGMVDKHVWGACGYAVGVRVPSLAPSPYGIIDTMVPYGVFLLCLIYSENKVFS